LITLWPFASGIFFFHQPIKPYLRANFFLS
jgi:hypothetical protein